MEEIRNSYKSNYVNSGLDECEEFCKRFENKICEKIPFWIDWLMSINSDECKNSWGGKIQKFGISKLKLLEIFTQIVKFKNNRILSILLEKDLIQKLFVNII